MNEYSKSEFLNRSFENNYNNSPKIVSRRPTEVDIDIENRIPEILERLKAGEVIEETSFKPAMPIKPRLSLIRPSYVILTQF